MSEKVSIKMRFEVAKVCRDIGVKDRSFRTDSAEQLKALLPNLEVF